MGKKSLTKISKLVDDPDPKIALQASIWLASRVYQAPPKSVTPEGSAEHELLQAQIKETGEVLERLKNLEKSLLGEEVKEEDL